MDFAPLGFDTHYRFEPELRSPRGASTFEITPTAGHAAAGVASGLPQFVVEVTPEGGTTWIGLVQGGGAGELTGAFGTPCPDAVLLVVKGQGYWVPVLSPDAFALVPLDPVRHVLRVTDEPVVVLADFSRLAAYGTGGLLWVTRELSWDGIEVTAMEDGVIRGLGWDATTDRQCSFAVEVATGACDGGARPLP